MKPQVGKTSALTRSRTFTFVRRARFSLRRASWSIMGMHFSTRHATAAAASPRRSGVQKKPLRKIPRKCKARLGDWRGSDDELCEPAEVLRGCRQGELELGTAWSAQAQTTQPEDPLEMCKQHLNPFASAARAIECFGLSQRPGYVTGLLVDAARILRNGSFGQHCALRRQLR